ncbi:AAA domain-containing protein [Streptomyces sp. NPDC050619]|uniref:AAA domain-containing protein n=1 Tax=Streptomyces sp. NPDC050619 TaxID=3157214 RepID=UPI003435BC3E
MSHLEDGWYALPTYERSVNPDDLTDLCLAPRTASPGTDGTSYRVISYTVEPERLKLQVGAHAPRTGLGLWAIGRPPDFLERSLHEALTAMGDPGLAERLVTGRLDPVAPPTSTACEGVLQGAQAQAYLACTTPGVRMVWGPPGTGKTTVLKRALDDLVTRGKRVLLVSGTNIAVDNALEGAVRTRAGLKPGEMVRVGTAHLASVAEDARVSLPLLVRARLEETESRRAAAEAELIELTNSPLLTRLRDLGHLLSGYDPDAYRQARQRLANGRLLDELAEKTEDIRTAVTAAADVHDRCAAVTRQRLEALEALAPQRALLDEAARLRSVLDGMESETLQAQSAARSAERRLSEARLELGALEQEKGLRARRRTKARRNELGRLVSALDTDWQQVGASASQAVAQYERQHSLLQPQIQAARAAARPVDEARVARHIDAVELARKEEGNALTRLSAEKRELAGAAAELATAQERYPRPSPDDRATVDAAGRAGLPGLDEERRRLTREAEPFVEQCRGLERRHEQLLKELDRLRARAEPDIIRGARVVATTLARTRIHKTVAEGPYDVVLVDEAAAAALPDIVVAVAKAEETAVLLGDFCQLGAVKHKRTPKEEHLARWLTRDCFELVGIRTPDEARAHHGCAALLTTHRFGPDVTELVNRIAYGSDRADGPRLVSAVAARDRDTDPEIVLITTDQLDDGGLGLVRTPRKGTGRWWTVGSVIAQALAERHRDQGESVGIVTPYKAQADITHDWLADQDSLNRSPAVEVGTAHRFQGREFDVVVLDLVEDGRRPGWTVKGRMDDADAFNRDGARLFNVGATRARRRVYIIASWAAISRADHGTVLAHVRELATPGPERRVLGVRAAQLLGLDELDVPEEFTPVQHEIWQAFDGHVRWDAIYDEHSYFPAALEAIDSARHTVWLWAPWYYKRLWEVLPHLHAARQRGVHVVVFVVEDSDKGLRQQLHDPRTAQDAQRRLPELIAAVSRVVRIRTMHQKILVVDDRTTFLGSLNTLSTPTGGGARREVMVRFRGSRFARSLLEHEHAEEFSRPVRCPKCHVDMELRKYSAKGKGNGKSHYWAWACPERRPDPTSGTNKACGALREVYGEDAVLVPRGRRV